MLPATLIFPKIFYGHSSSSLRALKSLLLPKSCIHKTSLQFLKPLSTISSSNQIINLSTKEIMATENGNGLPESMQTDNKEAEEKPLSKKAQKRLVRWQKYQEIKKKRKESVKQAHKDDAGYCAEDLEQTDYFFENGVRKVYPYNFVFATHAKGRWVGRTVEDVLQKEFGYDHEDDLKKSFDANQIHVNNKRVGPAYKVRDNDLLSHRTHRHENPVTWSPIEILKDTEDLIVINKPSSIPCHPCGRYRFNSVVFILGKEMGYTNLRNIYRLDRLTSGVLILAKTVEMTKTLEDQVVNRQVKKEYVCRVVGKFPEGTVLVDQPLRALSNKLRLQVVNPSGKASQTEFTRISYNGTSSVVRCRPFTGRTHQIRVHLQFLGHPIINDAFYNNPAWGPTGGKGGDYQIPFEQVCERILKEHHANLWDGGENPLYFEKVRQMEEMAQQSAAQVAPTNKSLPENNSSTVDVQCKSVSDLDADSNLIVEKTSSDGDARDKSVALSLASADNGQGSSPHDEGLEASRANQCNGGSGGSPGQEPPSKKSKTEVEEPSLSVPNTCMSTDSISSAPASSSSSLTNNSVDEMIPTGEETDDAVVNKIMETEIKRSDKQTVQSARVFCCAGRPGFDKDLWSINPLCELCKKLPIDPREKDLVMFLHALKYKGPDWEYETALPDWAEDGWNREEDYV